MTRETKIGLLIGLGFIVVFAVLLSYTAPPAGDDLPLVLAERGGRPAGMLDGTADPTGGDPEPGAGRVRATERGSPGTPAGLDHDLPAEGTPTEDLPHPDVFEPLPEGWYDSAMSEGTAPTETSAPGAEPTPVVEIIHRVAPALRKPIAEPEPTPRPDAPTESPEPKPEPARPTKPAEPTKVAPPKLYTVQAGDALGKIAKKFYGTASARVLDFLVSENRKQIKSKDLVVAGTRIKLPELPPELVEPASSFNAALINRGASTVKLEEILPPGVSTGVEAARRAPTPSKPIVVADGRSGTTGDKSNSKYRWYVVKPKDTLSSIARRELGSVRFWRDIQKLNRKIDPTKMRIGTKIRLPKKRPALEASASLPGSGSMRALA